MNLGQKRGSRFKPSWLSIKMLKLSTWIVQAGTAAGRLLRPTSSTTCHWGWWPQFLQKRPSRAAKMWINFWSIHGCASPHFLLAVRQFLNRVFLAQSVGPGGPTAWPAPSPDSYFYIWRHLISTVRATAVTDVQKVKQWSGANLRWFLRHLEFSNESITVQVVDNSSNFSYGQVAVNRKPCFWRPLFMWHLLLKLCCRSTICRFGRRLSPHLV